MDVAVNQWRESLEVVRIERFERSGVAVQFGHELVAFDQDAIGVSARMAHSSDRRADPLQTAQ